MTQQGMQLIKELTMEYVKQNNIMRCKENDIDSQVSKIAAISQLIYDAVDKNYHKFKFL